MDICLVLYVQLLVFLFLGVIVFGVLCSMCCVSVCCCIHVLRRKQWLLMQQCFHFFFSPGAAVRRARP